MVKNKYKKLYFFDKEGRTFDFKFDDANDRYYAKLFFPRTSIKLFESINLFIVEELQKANGSRMYGYPKMGVENANDKNWKLEWEDTDTKTISIYDFEYNEKEEAQLLLQDSKNVELDDYPQFNIDGDGYKVDNNINSQALQINFSFRAFDEGIYERKLYIKEVETGDIVAEIDFYAESEAEDERLNIMLDNLGRDILADEFKAFRDPDVNEDLVDYKYLNEKRKELLLEGHNIFPYRGSYKALVNIIRFFGYDNIKIREYWRLINEDTSIKWTDADAPDDWSTKYKSTDVINIMEDGADLSAVNLNVPSKKYKKTNRLSLVFRINKPTGEYDKYDVMETEELLQYPVEEVLLKLFSLKKILKKKYLPLNARIWEIIGEADYFNKVEFNVFTNQQRIDDIEVGAHPVFSVNQNERFIRDIRGLSDTFEKVFTTKADFVEVVDTSMSADEVGDFYVNPGYWAGGYEQS